MLCRGPYSYCCTSQWKGEGDRLAHLELELPQGLNEGHGLDVSHGPTQLNDAHVWGAIPPVHRDPSDALNPVLDGVGDVRHHLHRLPQVVPLAFTFNDRLQQPALTCQTMQAYYEGSSREPSQLTERQGPGVRIWCQYTW